MRDRGEKSFGGKMLERDRKRSYNFGIVEEFMKRKRESSEGGGKEMSFLRKATKRREF